jgi:hypothetical protein
MLSRLSNFWNQNQTPSSVRQEFSSNLGPLGLFIFATSTTSLEAVKQLHEIKPEEETFFSEIASANRKNGQTSSSALFSVSSPLITSLISSNRGTLANLKQSHVEALLSTFLQTPSPLVQHSSPENFLELAIYFVAVWNKIHGSREGVTTLAQLFSLLAVISVSENQNVVSPSMIVALVRTSATLLHNGQNPVVNAASDQVESFQSSMIRLFTDVIAVPYSNAKDAFLREICAPILSQFGFEFLWNFVQSQINQNDSARDLIHYCQQLTYNERLFNPNQPGQSLLPRSLGAQHLLAEISSSDRYFGGLDSLTIEEDATKSTIVTHNVLVPSFWKMAFRNIQKSLQLSVPTTTSRRSATDNQQLNNTSNNTTTEEESSLQTQTTAVSFLRRYRFSAKVAATTANTQSKNNEDSKTEFYGEEAFLELYKMLLSGNGASKLSDEVITRMNQVFAASSLSSSYSQLFFDPLMLTTYFFTASSSVTPSGRLWTLEKLFLSSSSSLSASQQTNKNNNNNNLTSTPPVIPSSVSHLLAPFWMISSLVLISAASKEFSSENEEGENRNKVELFEASFVLEILKRFETLFSFSLLANSGNNLSNEFISVMKLDVLIFGSGGGFGGNANNNVLDRGASIFRNSFCKFRIVQHFFRKVIRASYEGVLREEKSTQQTAEDDGSVEKKIKRIHYTVSELFSVVMSTVSKLTSLHSNREDKQSNNEEQKDFVSSVLVLSSFLTQEWRFAVKQFATNFSAAVNAEKKIAGDVTFVRDMVQRLISESETGLAQLREIESALEF